MTVSKALFGSALSLLFVYVFTIISGSNSKFHHVGYGVLEILKQEKPVVRLVVHRLRFSAERY